MKSNQLRYGLKRVFDMRKIKFRGKSKRSEGWLFGYLFEYGLMSPSNVPCICAVADISWRDCYDLYEVEPDTVGQCTGLKDRNGIDIYEGDVICSQFYEDKRVYHVVIWDENSASFRARLIKQGLPFDCCGIFQDWIDRFGKEVVGNIFDNKEFLEEE